MVMDREPDGSAPDAPSLPQGARFGQQSRPRLMMVWKRDRLVPGRNILDSKARGGGWGALATAMKPRGRWTARSLRTVEGLYAQSVPQVPGLQPSTGPPARSARSARKS